MRTLLAVALGAVTAALMGGCATPVLDHASMVRPKTVAIMDIPDARPAATIGVVKADRPQAYFMGELDPYFVATAGRFGIPPGRAVHDLGVSAGTAAGHQAGLNYRGVGGGVSAAAGILGLTLGSMIAASAEVTQAKAEAYPTHVKNILPGHDMRKEVLTGVGRSLETKGIHVRLLTESRNLAPRLRWPVAYTNGTPMEVGPLANSPAIDVDIVAQVVPMAVYAASGPLSDYNSVVGIGLALYDGRSRKFIGWQAFPSDQNKLRYAQYDALVGDIRNAAPAQRAALMSLVEQVSEAISGGKLVK